MPQLWTETFVTQYFWLLAILFTFYFFIATKVIPTIAEAIKARQLTEETTKVQEEKAEDKALNIFSSLSTSEINKGAQFNWDSIQAEWLTTTPEENREYWVNSTMSEEALLYASFEETTEETLENFLKEE